jgi:hypothetical protein
MTSLEPKRGEFAPLRDEARGAAPPNRIAGDLRSVIRGMKRLSRSIFGLKPEVEAAGIEPASAFRGVPKLRGPPSHWRPRPATVYGRLHPRIHPGSLLIETTLHPAQTPHEAPGDPSQYPWIPATSGSEGPAHAGNPRLSPLSPEPPRPACHAGGRGFESRRSPAEGGNSGNPRCRPQRPGGRAADVRQLLVAPSPQITEYLPEREPLA